MKRILITTLCISMLPMLAFTQSIDTKGDYSPTVVAKSFTATYGVRADAVQAVLEVYARQGLTPQERKARAENLIRNFKNAVPHAKGISQLTEADQQKLGIATEVGLVRALNWDMFARQYYLSTAGSNSPAIVAAGDVAIWYGIPEPALRTLAGRLEANAVELGEFGTQLQELAEKYEALKKEFEIYGPGDPVVRRAEKLLDEGKLEEAEALLESDYRVSKKRLAYKAYLFGKTKELLLKYEEAKEGYQHAVALDSNNVEYQASLASLWVNLAKFDNAKQIYEHLLNGRNKNLLIEPADKAELLNGLGIVWTYIDNQDNAQKCFEEAIQLLGQLPVAGNLKRGAYLNNLGQALICKGNYDEAIAIFEEAFENDSIAFGVKSEDVSAILSNLGVTHRQKGDFTKAIECYFKSLAIDTIIFGTRHPYVANHWNNIAIVYEWNGEFRKAIEYYSKAIEIDTSIFGVNHPQIAMYLNNLGVAQTKNGNIHLGIKNIEIALGIDTTFLGNMHSTVALHLNNLGSAWSALGNANKAIDYLEQALRIDLNNLDSAHSDIARDLSNLGSAWTMRKEYTKALSLHLQAFSIDSGALGMRHPRIGDHLGNLGDVMSRIGQDSSAIVYHKRAEDIYISAFGIYHPSVASTWSALGLLNQFSGEMDSAFLYFKKAMYSDSISLSWEHPNIVRDLKNLAKAYRSIGQFENAIHYCEKSIPILLSMYDMGHIKCQRALIYLSETACLRGIQLLNESKPTKALLYFQKALHYIDSTPNTSLSITCLLHIAQTHQQLIDHECALSVLNTAKERILVSRDTVLSDPQFTVPDSLARQVEYHRLSSLNALGRHAEAKATFKQLKSEAKSAKDEKLLQALRDESWKNEPLLIEPK